MPHSGSDSTYPTVQISGTISGRVEGIPFILDIHLPTRV